MGEKGNRRPKDIVEQQESLDCRMRSRRMRSQGNFFLSFSFFLFLLSLTVIGEVSLVSDIDKSNMMNWFLLNFKIASLCIRLDIKGHFH